MNMSAHAPCSACEGVEHHWLPYSDDVWTGYVCKHCPATCDDVVPDGDGPTCSECGAEIAVPLHVVDGFAPWLCLECSGASVSDILG
jgi:hypothetical protein